MGRLTLLHNFLTCATSVAPVIAVMAIMGVAACAAHRPRNSNKENA